MPKTKTLELIDRSLEERQGKGFRNHLGASIIGKDCPRQLWYTFRWFAVRHFSGRLLRLFDRGHREELAITKWLRRAGVHVLDVNPDTGQQFRVVDHWNHFGGSLDALLWDTPDFPGVWVLGEYKTHGSKSYNKLKNQGLAEAKWEHVVQMQIYMHYMELPAAIYFPVCKDNDDMEETQIVEFDPTVAERYIDRAGKIIFAPRPPKRINESPSWWQCKFCDYRGICHYGEPAETNCRTCRNSMPVEGGKWTCSKFNVELTETDQHLGCQQHEPMPHE